MKIYEFEKIDLSIEQQISVAKSSSGVSLTDALLLRIAGSLDALYALERDKVIERLSKDPSSHFDPSTGMEVSFYE